MDFITPPPLDRDLARARNDARAERVAADLRKPLIGAGIIAGVLRLVKRRRN